ncbi:uncharacterized protein BT62DRAFT_730619 [Guyanagaster necrorhizus]|uniref:Uncharacterized protein n=1 Tax=Guyanagaster necrorhizus TaxID=856835 RepID=A0A9P7VWJ5_9AGAR|nr:uncharacterized protein BT62DRAFT_730619 [Guyanagaster necrorhizus MCA 3950]KAG7448846.1 hypothetical protein BT62DRAFT_730619 [Guyanagaster necrorhizus MCA 3950]
MCYTEASFLSWCSSSRNPGVPLCSLSNPRIQLQVTQSLVITVYLCLSLILYPAAQAQMSYDTPQNAHFGQKHIP